jgi:hypothetical protein
VSGYTLDNFTDEPLRGGDHPRIAWQWGRLGGREKGPGQKAGEKIDQAVGKLTGKGSVEKAGEQTDKAVDELKKK